MESSTLIAIYMPFIIALILRGQNKKILMILNMKKRRSEIIMSNEMLMSCVNKLCNISTGSLGKTYSKVVVKEVIDNWVRVEKNGKIDLINSDYIQNIKFL